MKFFNLFIVLCFFSCYRFDVPYEELNAFAYNSKGDVSFTGLVVGDKQLQKDLSSRSVETEQRSYIKDIKLSNKKVDVLSSRVALKVIEKDFFVIDASGTYSSNKIVAKCEAVGTNCEIYVEKNSASYSADVWKNCAKEFDEKIYQKLTNVFGHPSDIDGNNKILILYYNIQSTDSVRADNICGFFNSTDLTDNAYSNKTEMMYLNLNMKPAQKPTDSIMFRTLAHEFQHMINYNVRNTAKLQQFDLWIDEASSMMSEEIYLNGEPLDDCLTYLEKDPQEYIRNGLSFIKFDNLFEQYCLAYVFLKYVQLQSKLDYKTFFTELLKSESATYKSVENILITNNNAFKDFSDILGNFHLANLIQAREGKASYLNKSEKYKWQVKYPTRNINYLYSGGVLYLKLTPSFKPVFNHSDIKFVRKDGSYIN